MLFTDICYEPITDQFWYGLFGDFKLMIDIDTGFFNATKLCNQGGKHFYHWLANKCNRELVDYYEQKRQQTNSDNRVLMKVPGGNQYTVDVSGTYASEELILSIGMWISKDFYDSVYRITRQYYVNQFQEEYKNNKQRLQEKLDDIAIRNEKQEGIDADAAAIKNSNPDKSQVFALIKTNVEHTSERDYPYYTLRTQRSNYRRRLKSVNQKYPNMTILLKRDYDPDPIKMFNKVKDKNNGIRVRYNEIKLLGDYTESQLINDITEAAASIV